MLLKFHTYVQSILVKSTTTFPVKLIIASHSSFLTNYMLFFFNKLLNLSTACCPYACHRRHSHWNMGILPVAMVSKKINQLDGAL